MSSLEERIELLEDRIRILEQNRVDVDKIQPKTWDMVKRTLKPVDFDDRAPVLYTNSSGAKAIAVKIDGQIVTASLS